MTNQIVTYLQKDAVKSRFTEIMGDRQASSYIASVLLTVANSDSLQKCSPESVYISALRAATLRLSVDASLGQAYLVPFKGKATLIIGYKGLYDLAIRTNRYRWINVDKLYQGEELVFDRISGIAHLEGGKISDEIIGWLGSFEMTSGYSKVIYMSVEELDAHAQRYSKSYALEGSLWKTDTNKMYRKTILRLLLRRWGYFDPNDAAVLSEVEEDAGEVVEGDTTEEDPQGSPPSAATQPDEPAQRQEDPIMSTEQAIEDLGF